MLRNSFHVLLLTVALTCLSCSGKKIDINSVGTSENIRLNQLGYLPGSVKKLVITSSESEGFNLVDSSGNVIYSGALEDKGEWELSKEMIKIADFSSFNTPGTYRIYVNDLGVSNPFRIGTDVYSDVFKASVRAFYLQRASMAIEEKYAGKYNHPMAHPDDTCFFHPSSGKSRGFMSSPGGWYDAGDYNKYIVNAGFTVSSLLTFYENYPTALPDNSLGIPESGNGISDLLDEIKYELDWAETMQDEDGGVFFKLTSKSFCGFVKPQDDNMERFVVGKSTTSALNFAAMFAQASRVWKGTDPALSARYVSIAKNAWEWAVKNPGIEFRNPVDISTGGYGHSDFSGDFYWVASELFVTTGDSEYHEYLKANPVDFGFVPEENWRNYLANLGYYALILPASALPEPEKDAVKKAIMEEADRQIANLEKCPCRQPLSTFAWGSNSDILDLGMIFAQAYQLSKDNKYLDAAIETTDYIFGKNATAYSFVTGFGSKPVMNPHHRLSAADGIEGPIPGWVAGGPNRFVQDARSDRNKGGIVYTSTEPAKAFMDLEGSWASNEIAINWNGPLVYMTGFLEMVSAGQD
jgi:endoglucanase